LLQQTPLGTDFSAVKKVVRDKGWLDSNYIETHGFMKQESGESPQEVGVASIRGSLGSYRLEWHIDVTAFWGFDTNGQLVDVWVWKTADAP
jgi:hypothetical protein